MVATPFSAVPESDWPLPAPVINQHGIAQRCEAIAGSIAAVMSADEIARLPSGLAYGQLGVLVRD